MILEFSDWLFLANDEMTKILSDEELESHCTCAYCRNFYKTVDGVYPDLRYFLSRFGLNIEAPEALIPLTSSLYQASYVAQGRILRYGSEPIFVNDLAITIEDDPESDTFVIQTGIMNLPWELPDDPNNLSAPCQLSDYFNVFRS